MLGGLTFRRALLALCLTASFCGEAGDSFAATICTDPGHGGTDAGMLAGRSAINSSTLPQPR